MNPHSEHRFRETFRVWRVLDAHADPMINYLVRGFSPGSFFTAVLANDCLGAFQRSHPVNRMQDLKNLAGWIRDHVPVEARGNYKAVEDWCELDEKQRRTILERQQLIHSEPDETWLTLQDPSPEIYSSDIPF